MCMSLWHCWSIMFVVGGGMTKGEELGQRAQRWGKRKKKTKYVLVQFDLMRCLSPELSGQPKGVGVGLGT